MQRQGDSAQFFKIVVLAKLTFTGWRAMERMIAEMLWDK